MGHPQGGTAFPSMGSSHRPHLLSASNEDTIAARSADEHWPHWAGETGSWGEVRAEFRGAGRHGSTGRGVDERDRRDR